MKWPGRSLKIVFPFRVSVIVIIVILPLFVFSYLVVDRFVVRQKLGDLMNLADAKYVQVLDLLDFGKNINSNWASSPILRESLNAYEQKKSEKALTDMKNELTSFKDTGVLPRPHAFKRKPFTRERFHEVLVTNADRVVVASNEKREVGEDLSKSPIFKAGKGSIRNTYTSDVFLDADGRTFFAFVSPVYKDKNDKGTILGFLVTKVDTGLLTMIMNADLGNITGGKLWFAGFQYKSLDIYIMDSRGWMITQSQLTKNNSVLKQKGSELPLERGLDENAPNERETNEGLVTGGREAMEIYRGRNGNYVAGASMHLFDNGWTVVVEQNTSDALAGLFFLKIALIIGGFIAALLAGFIAWMMTRRITDSLADMGTESIKLASGDFSARIKVKPDEYNEISVLASSLNIMAENLRSNFESEEKKKIS